MKLVNYFFIFVLFFSSSFATEPFSSLKLDLSKGVGVVEFLAVGRPSFLKIKGHGETPQGILVVKGNSISGVVSFNLNSLDTGINLRNEHMKEKYLETQKFPKAELIITKMTLPSPFWSLENISLEDISYEGSLSLHGVKKTINGIAKIKRQKNTLDVKTDFKLKLKDFGMNTPAFKGITVSEDVEVYVAFSIPI